MSDLEKRLTTLGISAPVAMTIGTFDGVHRGHQRLLETLRDAAAESGMSALAVTFRTHPRMLINPGTHVPLLATLEHRLGLMRASGVASVLPVDFDDELRSKTADEFLSMLAKTAGVKLLVVGPGARIGNDRAGMEELGAIGAGRGIEIVVARPEMVGGEAISSSAIRRLLEAGDVKGAGLMLGRAYRLSGTVVQGDSRGLELGFPTANIAPDGPLALPGDGIYATTTRLGGETHMAATSIGIRPTFGGTERKVEAYILDFEEDIYGRAIDLEFIARLRGEVKFDGAGQLVEQMTKDVSETRQLLSGAT